MQRLMGLMLIYQKPDISKAAKGHKIYTYRSSRLINLCEAAMPA